jgi:hypothetical protein
MVLEIIRHDYDGASRLRQAVKNLKRGQGLLVFGVQRVWLWELCNQAISGRFKTAALDGGWLVVRR